MKKEDNEMIKIKNKLVILILSSFIIILVGCSNESNKNIQSTSNESNPIGAEQAKEIMTDKVPNGKLVEFGYNNKGSLKIFEGKIIKNGKEYDINVDSKTGEIINYDEERIDKTEAIYNGSIITEDVAKNIILKRAGKGALESFKYDGYDSIPIYEGKVVSDNKETEIMLDARDGKIIGIEIGNIHK